MKKLTLLFTLIYGFVSYSLFGVMSHYISPKKDTRQLIIHFTKDPRDGEEHKKWNNIIHEAKEQLNEVLLKKKYKYFIQRIWQVIKEWYYLFVFRERSSKYSHKRNEVFFTRLDHDFGNFTLYIPDGISENIVIQHLREILDQQEGVTFHIDKNIAVHIAQNLNIGLEGIALTLQELEAVKRAQRKIATKKDSSVLKLVEKRTKSSSEIKNQAFWHHRIPTVGLRLISPFYPPPYPFIPHMFSLWQLAPKKGNGVNVAVIDTGVSAASFLEKDENEYRKNQDLTLPPNTLHKNLNIVSHNGLDPIEQLVNVVYPYIEPQLFNEIEISQEVIDWVYDYLQNNKSVDKIISYLKTKEKKTLFDVKGKLSQQGKQALENITTGPYGIEKSQLQIVTMKEPFKTQVIQQLLPLAPISDQKVTYISGHGSHTLGLVAGLYQGKKNSPDDDIGICGLAPEANVVMIKAFKDDGTSDKSTLIAALKKAILYNVDVVNLSLKIADNMDVTASLSKLLERMIGLVPYVVAASGNGGDPQLKNYAGKVEAYPAKFGSVAFDVGSFGFKGMKCSINPFSQYEKNIGPKVVAPGFNIISSALIPGQKEDSMYVFMDGTSMAAPLMTGFVALMLAEFQDDFTRDELLNVCYSSTIRMHNNNDWKQKVLLGTVDMRTALFVLHVLRKTRKEKLLKGLSFNKLLTAIYEVIFAQPKKYGQVALDGADFIGDFMTYFSRAQKRKQKFQQEQYFVPQSLDDAIMYVVHSLVLARNSQQVVIKKAEPGVLKRITNIFKRKEAPDIFARFNPKVKKRIITTEKEEDYWQTQAKKIREQLVTRHGSQEV